MKRLKNPIDFYSFLQAKKYILLLCSLFVTIQLKAQKIAQKKIQLSIDFVDKDSSFHFEALQLQTRFVSTSEALTYISNLPSLLAEKGFPAASVDTLFVSDSLCQAKVYLGVNVARIQLIIRGLAPGDPDSLVLHKFFLSKKNIQLNQLTGLKQNIVGFYEERGFPFASVCLDSIFFHNNEMKASLRIEKGKEYYIDSIRVLGQVNISKHFLERYLELPKHGLYNKKKLSYVDKRILELPFLSTTQPSDITMLGSGGMLNLYLQAKKASQFNFLVGFLPTATNTGKVQVTGDVNLDLKNMFGGGERVLLKWQQLQPQSPRLNLGFNKPYLFNSPFGFEGLFDLFKKDSSFIQINAKAGFQYAISGNQTGKMYVQWQNTNLLPGSVDTLQIKATNSLPANIDVSSVNMGIDYNLNKTDYRLNPRSGNELMLSASIGVKNIRKNNDIISIKDPSFNSTSLYDSILLRTYQLRVKLNMSQYFPIGKSSTIKTSLQAGIYNSPVIFRNELFQIGGFALLRGFDEEGIFATQYGVLSTEYRFLLAMNSYLSFFMDAGLTQNRYQQFIINNRYIGGGIGIVYETKSGLLNVSLAVGKRNDLGFDIRQATKLHFGYINYF